MFSQLSGTLASRRRGRAQRVFDGRPHRLSVDFAPQTEQSAGLYTTMAGRAAPYNVFTPRWSYHLAIAPGAFDKTLREFGAGLPLLLFHDNRRFPVGNARHWDATGDGLDAVWDLDSTPDAQEVGRLADNGMMTGLSVGMYALLSDWVYTGWEDWDYADPSTWDTCTVIEARLDEVSVTPTPGYQQARIHYALDAVQPGRARHAEARPIAAGAQAWLDTMRNS